MRIRALRPAGEMCASGDDSSSFGSDIEIFSHCSITLLLVSFREYIDKQVVGVATIDASVTTTSVARHVMLEMVQKDRCYSATYAFTRVNCEEPINPTGAKLPRQFEIVASR